MMHDLAQYGIPRLREAAVSSIFLVALLLVPAGPLFAEKDTTPLPISVDEAVRMALKNNEVIMIAREQELKASGTVREAYSGALPKINASAQYQGNFLKPAFFAPEEFADGGKIEIGGDVEVMGTIRLDQVLYAFGRVGKAIDFARIYEKTASLGIEQAEYSVAVSAKEAYYRVLLLQHFFQIRRTSLGQAISHLTDIELKHNEGIASRFDLQRAKVEVKMREPELIRAESDVHLALQDLERIIGLPHGSCAVILDSLTFVHRSISVEDAVAEGLANRPEIRTMILNVEGRKKVLGIYKADLLPVLRCQS